MGYMIEITEKKVDKLSEHLEQGLRHLGKAMQCVDEWMQESGMGERGGNYGNRGGQGGYGSRGGYGNRYDEMEMRERESYGSRAGYRERGGSMGYRDDEEEWDEMGERRGVRGSGRGRR